MTTPLSPGCWATLITSPKYLAGCLTLHHSLLKHHSIYPLVVYATPDLDEPSREVLKSFGIEVHEVGYLRPKESHKFVGDFVRFDNTWTKLRAWELVGYERVVMIDSDMLVRQNMDELMTMDLPTDFIAAAHACTCNPNHIKHYPASWIPANCAHTRATTFAPLPASSFVLKEHHKINSGLVVLRPSLSTMSDIQSHLLTHPDVVKYQFPDQDLIAAMWREKLVPLCWKYNALKTLRHCHETVWRDDVVKNVHYILDKPWKGTIHGRNRIQVNAEVTHGWWWKEWEELLEGWGEKPGRAMVITTVNSGPAPWEADPPEKEEKDEK